MRTDEVIDEMFPNNNNTKKKKNNNNQDPFLESETFVSANNTIQYNIYCIYNTKYRKIIHRLYYL